MLRARTNLLPPATTSPHAQVEGPAPPPSNPRDEGWAAGKDAAWKKFQEFHERKIRESHEPQEAQDRESEGNGRLVGSERSSEGSQPADDSVAAAPVVDLQC